MAMYIRTKKARDHWIEQYESVVNSSDRIIDMTKDMGPSERQRMFASLDASEGTHGASMSIDEFRDLARNPLPSHLDSVPELAIILHRTYTFLVLVSAGSKRFLTSDAPCVWYDPAANQSPSRAGGLSSPTMEITLPVSPELMLYYGPKHKMPVRQSGVYLHVLDDAILDELNKRTVLWADESIVSSTHDANEPWTQLLQTSTGST